MFWLIMPSWAALNCTEVLDMHKIGLPVSVIAESIREQRVEANALPCLEAAALPAPLLAEIKANVAVASDPPPAPQQAQPSPPVPLPNAALDHPYAPFELELIENVDASATELYRRGRVWFTKIFVNPDRVLDLEDPDGHRLAGKGACRFVQTQTSGSDATKGYIRYTVVVDTKDGRYRFWVGSFAHDGATLDLGLLNNLDDPGELLLPRVPKSWRTQVWADLKRTAMAEATALRDSMRLAMRETDDW